MGARRHRSLALAGALLVLLGSCSTTATVAAPGSSAPRVVAIGDSIMAGKGLAAGEDWPQLMADREGFPLVNLACPGAGFVHRGECGLNYAGQIDAAAAADPTVIVIQSSRNDIRSSPDAIAAATAGTIARLRAACPTARIIGLSTIWNDHADLPAEIASSSTALRIALAPAGGRFLDIGQPLAGHPEWMQSDDIHPTLAGQRVILDRVTEVMRTAGVRF